jgi:hypothetical protein
MRTQWFTERAGGASIDSETFRRVTGDLGFVDTVLLSRVPEPDPRLSTRLQQVPEGQDRSLIQTAAARWAESAPIAGGYADLRAERMDGDARRELLTEFAASVADAGLMTGGGWARLPPEYYERGEPDDDWREPAWEDLHR